MCLLGQHYFKGYADNTVGVNGDVSGTRPKPFSAKEAGGLFKRCKLRDFKFRWYFNPLTQQCQPCVYRGLQGNENNFLSKQECDNSCLGRFSLVLLNNSFENLGSLVYSCPLHQHLQEDAALCLVNACKIGSPYRSQGVVVQCSAANPTVCPAGYYCHVGADSSTSVCCQALG